MCLGWYGITTSPVVASNTFNAVLYIYNLTIGLTFLLFLFSRQHWPNIFLRHLFSIFTVIYFNWIIKYCHESKMKKTMSLNFARVFSVSLLLFCSNAMFWHKILCVRFPFFFSGNWTLTFHDHFIHLTFLLVFLIFWSFTLKDLLLWTLSFSFCFVLLIL